MPTYCNKGNKRYFYYLCHKDSIRDIPECPVHQIPASDIEQLVKKQLKRILGDITLVTKISELVGVDGLEPPTFTV